MDKQFVPFEGQAQMTKWSNTLGVNRRFPGKWTLI